MQMSPATETVSNTVYCSYIHPEANNNLADTKRRYDHKLPLMNSKLQKRISILLNIAAFHVFYKSMKLLEAPGEAAKVPLDLSTCHCSSSGTACAVYQAMQMASLGQAARPGALLWACQVVAVHCRSPPHTCMHHDNCKASTMIAMLHWFTDRTRNPTGTTSRSNNRSYAASVFSLTATKLTPWVGRYAQAAQSPTTETEPLVIACFCLLGHLYIT